MRSVRSSLEMGPIKERPEKIDSSAAFNSDGISSIRISTNTTDWEIDHLQYGAESQTIPLETLPVPEPSTLTLLGLGVVVSRYRAYRRGRPAGK